MQQQMTTFQPAKETVTREVERSMTEMDNYLNNMEKKQVGNEFLCSLNRRVGGQENILSRILV